MAATISSSRSFGESGGSAPESNYSVYPYRMGSVVDGNNYTAGTNFNLDEPIERAIYDQGSTTNFLFSEGKIIGRKDNNAGFTGGAFNYTDSLTLGGKHKVIRIDENRLLTIDLSWSTSYTMTAGSTYTILLTTSIVPKVYTKNATTGDYTLTKTYTTQSVTTEFPNCYSSSAPTVGTVGNRYVGIIKESENVFYFGIGGGFLYTANSSQQRQLTYVSFGKLEFLNDFATIYATIEGSDVTNATYLEGTYNPQYAIPLIKSEDYIYLLVPFYVANSAYMMRAWSFNTSTKAVKVAGTFYEYSYDGGTAPGKTMWQLCNFFIYNKGLKFYEPIRSYSGSLYCHDTQLLLAYDITPNSSNGTITISNQPTYIVEALAGIDTYVANGEIFDGSGNHLKRNIYAVAINPLISHNVVKTFKAE